MDLLLQLQEQCHFMERWHFVETYGVVSGITRLLSEAYLFSMLHYGAATNLYSQTIPTCI